MPGMGLRNGWEACARPGTDAVWKCLPNRLTERKPKLANDLVTRRSEPSGGSGFEAGGEYDPPRGFKGV